MTRVAALVLAAGQSRRFGSGDSTKAVACIDGVPLVRAVAASALASRAVSVTIVTGHARAEVEAAVRGFDVGLAHNAEFAAGMAGSLNVGIATVPDDIDGALILLADMPFVRRGTLDALIARFDERHDEVDAIVPVFKGQRGNPVLVGRRLFVGIETISGDQGARRLLSAPGVRLDCYDVHDPGVVSDIDTRAELDVAMAGTA